MDATEKTEPLPNEHDHQQLMNAECGYASLVDEKEDGTQQLYLLIGGVHCAVCIQKIESTLYANDMVEKARLNFSTGRLHIVWKGGAEQANIFAKQIESLGYKVSPYDVKLEESTAEKENKFLLVCLGVAGFTAGNLMLLSVGLWATTAETMGMATREFMHWLSAIIAVPAIMFSGRPFFMSALKVLKNRQTNMDVPISLALILATGMSLLETLNGGEHVYYDSAVMLMFFLLIGRYLDFKARRTAKSAAMDLMQTLSGFATVLEGNKTRRVLIRDLEKEMLVSVAVGEKFPIDGVIEKGNTSVDTSLVTGETLPVDLKRKDQVYAGTINLTVPVTVKVSGAVEDSLLAEIVRIMEKAEQGQAKYVRMADKAAKLYTPVVHTLAIAAFFFWWLGMGADWQQALMISVTVLIITCPCALGLAVPVVQVLATGRLMKRGVLVKSGDALERLANIDTILLDKTGTLTCGTPKLIGKYDEESLKLARSLAQHSKHPLSQALVNTFDGKLFNVTGMIEKSGKGLEGQYKGKTIRLGSRSWCGDENSKQHDELEIWMNVDGEKPVLFLFKDQLRNDAPDIIQKLMRARMDITLLSGDRKKVADSIAQECGIQNVLSEQSPVQKYKYLKALKKQGHQVLMVGDGLNDAPVLSGADVSIAPGTAIDVAQNAADIIFMGEKLHPIYEAYLTAVSAQKLVKQNFTLAVLYNFVAIPLAFMGMVTPLIAAICMSGSSLLVIANSFRLRLRA